MEENTRSVGGEAGTAEETLVLERIRDQGHGNLFHFTSVENLPLIRKMGGLCSMEELCPHEPKRSGGDSRIDPKDINWPYVFLNFTPATPMSYERKHDRHLCMFVISPIAACGDRVLFTTTNSSNKRAERIPGIEGLKRIDWPAVKMPTSKIKYRKEWENLPMRQKWAEWKFSVQAEALVPGKIPLCQVERVAFVSEASKFEGFREWERRTYSDCTCEEKLWAEEKFVVDAGLFRDSPPFLLDEMRVYSNDCYIRHPKDYVSLPFPIRTWIRENPEGENPNALSPVLYRGDVDSVTLVVEAQMDSAAIKARRRKKHEKEGNFRFLPEVQVRAVWSCSGGKTLRTITTTRETKENGMPTEIEFRAPIAKLADGLGSVRFEVRDPLWGDFWVRWSTLDFEIRSPNFKLTVPMPKVVRWAFSLQSRFRGAMVLGAVGDALGWPTEFPKPNIKPRSELALPIRDLVVWDKTVDGRCCGYPDTIGMMEYSDNTQLTLAVARSISVNRCLMSQHYSHAELPLWLQYERGGGCAIKIAAKWLLQKKDWQNNFYRQDRLDFRIVGDSGAAMRNLPISLVTHKCESKLIEESIFQAIITHGHPRGILGTVLAATSVYLALRDVKSPEKFIDRLHGGLAHAYDAIEKNKLPVGWLQTWDARRLPGESDFLTQLRDAKVEADEFLDKIPEFFDKETREYYRKVGALGRRTKSPGTGNVCSAIYLFLKMSDDPIGCLREAANLLGSDTGTTASILGGLLGARHGIEIVPSSWFGKVQDREHLVATADKLWCVAAGGCTLEPRFLGKDEAIAKILEWEEGDFCKMFSGKKGVNDGIEHPTLGPGKIIDVAKHGTPQKGYVTKLIRVKFKCEQFFDSEHSCVFHSIVGPKGQPAANLKEMLNGD